MTMSLLPSESINKIAKKDNSRHIVVTGFGPFSGHELVNASWEAVKLLPELLKSKNQNEYRIKKKLIQVTYTDVDSNIEKIWEKKPDLVVHCGVNGEAKNIHIENSAYNRKFNRLDCSFMTLPESTACLTYNGKHCERLETKLNLKKISQNVNNTESFLKIKENPILVSNDVGSYLCGYIYLKSLDINCQRTLFIHVPRIDKPFSSQETSNLLFQIIEECIEQIEWDSLNYHEEQCQPPINLQQAFSNL